MMEGAFNVYISAGQEHRRSYFEERLSAIDQAIANLGPVAGFA